jgi:hypothetical protein
VSANKVDVTSQELMRLATWIIQAYHHTNDFQRMAEEIAAIVAKKNHDYGDAWQRYGIFTPLIRINDKILRVKTLSGGEQALVAGEAIKDTLNDIVAYGLLALLRLEWEQSGAATPTFPSTPFQPELFSDPEAALKTLILDEATDKDWEEAKELHLKPPHVEPTDEPKPPRHFPGSSLE